jgi:hypothetical protein
LRRPKRGTGLVQINAVAGHWIGDTLDILSEGGLKANHAPMLAEAVPL